MADEKIGSDPLGIGIQAQPETPAVGFEENGGAPADNSIVNLLRQELAEIEKIEFVHIPIVGYPKINLTARYRLPDKGREIDQMNRDIDREFRGESTYVKNLFLSITMMAILNEGLYVQPAGRDEPVELDLEDTGRAVTYSDCHSVFGFDPSLPTREVIRRIFGGPKHDMALLLHSEKLNRWISNTKTDLTLEFWQTSGE